MKERDNGSWLYPHFENDSEERRFWEIRERVLGEDGAEDLAQEEISFGTDADRKLHERVYARFDNRQRAKIGLKLPNRPCSHPV